MEYSGSFNYYRIVLRSIVSRRGDDTVDPFSTVVLMTDTDIALPAEWTKKPEETQHNTAVVKYQHKTAEDTTFVVSVMSKSAERGFKLQLSVINRTSQHVRHDYPIDDYDAVEDAVEGAQSFIEIFSQRLQEGSISSADPEIEAIRETIETFGGNRVFPSIERLLRRFW